MRLLLFESKKILRLPGIRFLLIGVLVLNLLFCIFYSIPSPTQTEQESYISGYEESIRYVIRLAKLNATEYEASVGADNFNVRYQQDVAKRYSKLLDAGVMPSAVQGWNEFFSLTADDILLVVLVMLVGIMSTMTEWDTGTLSLLATAKRGRASVLSKIGFLSAFTFTAVIAVYTSSLIGIGIRFGLSSPFVPLCSVMEFASCPYDISVFSYLIISGLLKTLHLICLSVIATLAAALTKSWLISFIASAAFILLGYGISTIQSANGLVLCNPYTLVLTDPLFLRYRAVNLLNHSVSLMIIAVLLIILAFLFATAVYLVVMLQGSSVRSLAASEKRIFTTLRKMLDRLLLYLPKKKPRQRSLLFMEAKKSFIKSHLFLLCIVMLIVKIGYVSHTVPKPDPGELFYKELCDSMEGELTNEKRLAVWDGLDQANNIISQHDSMRNALQNNRITGEEYSSYMETYYRAQIEHFAYSKLNAQCQRIDMLAEKGETAKILYDSGWQHAFSLRFDVVLSGFLLLFFACIYDMEYKSGFYRLASLSARGLSSLHIAKTQLALIVTTTTFFVYTGVDLYFILQSYALPHPSFSAGGLMSTSASLGIMLCLYTCGKLIISILYALSIVFLTRFLRRTYLALPIGFLVLAGFGVVTNL